MDKYKSCKCMEPRNGEGKRMTREEARVLLRTLNNQVTSAFYDGDFWVEEGTFEAFEVADAALRDPQPDPITGLVPCGCGCEPELRNEDWGWYQVYCTGCDMHGGNSHTPDGVIEEWNTAMGYTAPSRPDAGEMAPTGDEGAES